MIWCIYLAHSSDFCINHRWTVAWCRNLSLHRQRQMAGKQQSHPAAPTVEFTLSVRPFASSALEKHSNYHQNGRRRTFNASSCIIGMKPQTKQVNTKLTRVRRLPAEHIKVQQVHLKLFLFTSMDINTTSILSAAPLMRYWHFLS